MGSGRRQVLRVVALATLSRNFQIDFLRPCLGRPDLEVILTSGSLVELSGMLCRLALDVLCNTAPGTVYPDSLVAHRAIIYFTHLAMNGMLNIVALAESDHA